MDKQSKRPSKGASPITIVGLIMAGFVAVYFLSFVMANGFLVTIEEQQEFGNQPITGDQCKVVGLANWFTGRNVPCWPDNSGESKAK